MNIEQPVVTVVIPAYNAQCYIDSCIESLERQNYKNLQILVIDDGSTDETAERCSAWAHQDKRIEVIHQQNQGVSVARNTGIDHALGDYLMFVDADDQLADDAVNSAVRRMRDSCAEILCFDFLPFNEDSILPRDTVTKQVFPKLTTSSGFEALGQLHTEHICNFIWMFMYSTDFLKSNDLRFTKGIGYGEDALFINQMLFVCKVVGYYDMPLYRYRRDHESVSIIKTHKNALDDIEVTRVLDGLFRNSPIEKSYKPYRFKLLIAAYAAMPWEKNEKERKTAKWIRENLISSMSLNIIGHLDFKRSIKLILIVLNLYERIALATKGRAH
jgi:glycosyltransferase involved in cell wall biosynthesis